jgi:hypothetical protein
MSKIRHCRFTEGAFGTLENQLVVI